MPQANKDGFETPPEASAETVGRIRTAFWTVARSMGQVRVHERLVRAAGVRVDRAGGNLLYMLHAQGDSLRVTGLADLLGVDAPTVTRKVQQLEREGMVARQADAQDRRATRIRLTPSGGRALEQIMRARREWFDHLLEGWEEGDLAIFATMLERFAVALEQDLEDARGEAGC